MRTFPVSMPKHATAVLLTIMSVTFAVHAQTFSVVYNFGSQAGDPIQPFYSGIIAQGRDGNLYSGSYGGGGTTGAGALYSLTPGGTLTTLYSFSNSTDGETPAGGLTLGSDGSFYGTSYGGGFGGAPFGTVFKFTPPNSFTTLYTFTDGSDGALPLAPPIQATDGNFYGTTCPGCNSQPGYGSIYKITPSGTFTVLFTCDVTHCYDVNGPLVQGKDGNLYGTSEFGGANSQGAVFKITPAGKITDLVSFDISNGQLPIGPLVPGSDGNFYGTAVDGGSFGHGVIFKVTGGGVLTVLHHMNGSADGGAPYAGLVQATDGNFYGVNANGGAASANCPSGCGTVFKLTPKGVFSVIYNFDLTTGSVPYTTLLQHTNGLLYGTTQMGGTGNVDPHCIAGVCGVLFSVKVGAKPFVALRSTTGKVGAQVQILGQNFSGSSIVSFGTVPASTVTVSGTTFITATVPSGAKTGSVTVTTSSGTLASSKKFLVTPQITTVAPPSGAVGSLVTITGVSLIQAKKVTFGGVSATFTVNSDTQITATVPNGAKTGKIVVTTPGGTATSALKFTVT